MLLKVYISTKTEQEREFEESQLENLGLQVPEEDYIEATAYVSDKLIKNSFLLITPFSIKMKGVSETVYELVFIQENTTTYLSSVQAGVQIDDIIMLHEEGSINK